MQESGCRLEHPSATKFRNHVMEGEWDKVGLGLPWLHSGEHFDRQGISDLSWALLSVLDCKHSKLFGQEIIRHIVEVPLDLIIWNLKRLVSFEHFRVFLCNFLLSHQSLLYYPLLSAEQLSF